MSKTTKFGPFRCIFPQLAEPKAFQGQEADKAKYKITLLIPKTDKEGYKKVSDFITAAINECAEWKTEIKKQVLATAKKTIGEEGANNNCILRDGDELNAQYLAEDKKPREAYAGHWVVSINRPAKWGAPLVVDRKAQEIPGSMIDSTVRPGYHVIAEVSAYCYKKPRNGITLQLQGVQLVKKDAEFGRENTFEAIEGDEEETENGTFED